MDFTKSIFTKLANLRQIFAQNLDTEFYDSRC